MRTQIIRNISVALLAAASVFAQGPQKVTARIPFGFHAGNSVFPAGEYILDTLSQGILRVRSNDLKSAGLMLSMPLDRPGAASGVGKGRLIFHKYGDQYFLSQIWNADNTSGRELRTTKREFEAASALERGVTSIMASK